MAFNNIHNALSDMLQDMDISEHYEGAVRELSPASYDVSISAKLDPSKTVMFGVRYDNNFQKVEVKILSHTHFSPMFAQLILENLAIQINPDYYA